MSKPSVTMNASDRSEKIMTHGAQSTSDWRCLRRIAGSSAAALDDADALARGAIGLEHVLERFERAALAAREHGLDQPRDVGEADVAGEKARDRDFVGGVEHGGRAAAGCERFVREAQDTGKRAMSGAWKCSAPMRARSRKSTPGVDALGKAERVGDRRAHVGIAELRDHRAVDVLDQRMDDALADGSTTSICVGPRVEQPARLDHFEALVHHRRRIDRDLAAHHPVGMRARLRPASRARARARDASRNGPPEAVSRMRRTPDGVEIRREARAAAPGRSRCARCRSAAASRRLRARPHEHRARRDQRFLVGEQDALAGAAPRRTWAASPAMPTIAAMTVSTSGSVATRSSASAPAQHFGVESGARSARRERLRGLRVRSTA